MPSYFRRWYLLFRLKLRVRRFVADTPDFQGVEGIADGNFIYFGKHPFVKGLCEKMFFIFPRTLKSQRKRMSKDEAILEVCINQNPQLVEQRTAKEVKLWREEWKENMRTIKESTPMIRITGDGEDFSEISNFLFVHLPARYKWVGTIFLAICGIVWLSVLKTPICSSIHIISSWYVCQ